MVRYPQLPNERAARAVMKRVHFSTVYVFIHNCA